MDIEAGQKRSMICGSCTREFALSYEPYSNLAKSSRANVLMCPFCGSRDLRPDEREHINWFQTALERTILLRKIHAEISEYLKQDEPSNFFKAA